MASSVSQEVRKELAVQQLRKVEEKLALLATLSLSMVANCLLPREKPNHRS